MAQQQSVVVLALRNVYSRECEEHSDSSLSTKTGSGTRHRRSQNTISIFMPVVLGNRATGAPPSAVRVLGHLASGYRENVMLMSRTTGALSPLQPSPQRVTSSHCEALGTQHISCLGISQPLWGSLPPSPQTVNPTYSSTQATFPRCAFSVKVFHAGHRAFWD